KQKIKQIGEKNETEKEILEEIEETKNIGLTMAVAGINPYNFTGTKLDKLYKELKQIGDGE
ncbi:unnamed protein product, partial [marine sediment metagenome]